MREILSVALSVGGAFGLVTARIALLGGSQLDSLQDYSPDDVAAMKVEIERLRTLSEALGALR
ncbi:hypothetical protein NE857_21615 [Nocardiopsis exhalans]|uniref:Uncharacterized protein n=1 Tax=Nocardiopsis exhalans TaxID=163604 RepID=A0ABY5D2D8_9ACTN|nr:hypothetical protein [Nocardiopsis exhalans]USY17916.1 hypothetical protein NE857_21615 [Nocardiopsis exhalans]